MAYPRRVVTLMATAAEWLLDGRVLAIGELGVELDTGLTKLGDGVTVWASLAYREGDISPTELSYLNGASSNIQNQITALVTGAIPAEIDRFNDVSAYQESVIAAGALTTTKKYSGLSLVGAGAVTLAAPPVTMLGQFKMIEMILDNGDVTLLLSNVVGQSSGTTATFNDAGDKLILQAAFDKWVVMKEFGITLA